MGQTLTFRLDIDADELMRFYRGETGEVVARADDGRTVRFPAVNLRAHVAAGGVRGRFRLRFDDDFRFVALERIGA